MSSLSAKDRVSLCMFTFSDGRRCRTPRNRNHPHFCFYHAQKEARARAAQSLGKDLAYFFSGDYLSACDLSTALARLIPAVLRGDVEPRAARTVAYLAQTLMQAIHISQDEYINAFDTDDWRRAIRNSVKRNYDYLFPPALKPAPSAFRETLRNEQPESPQPQPQPAPPQPVAPASTVCHPERSEGSHIIPATQPAPSPHAPLPSTRDEFAQHLLAGRNLSRSGREVGGGQAPQPAQTPVNCHSDAVAPAFRPEEPVRSSSSAPPQIQAQRNSPTPPAKAPQPTSVAPSFRSGALPPRVRRRLHRAPV